MLCFHIPQMAIYFHAAHTHTHTHSISMGRMSITSSLIFSLLQAYRTAKGPSVVASVAKWPIMLQSKTRVFFFFNTPHKASPWLFSLCSVFYHIPALSFSYTGTWKADTHPLGTFWSFDTIKHSQESLTAQVF